MFITRQSTSEDLINIKSNHFFDEQSKIILLSSWQMLEAQTLLNGDEIVAIALFREFHPDLYSSGIVIKNNVSLSELKRIKKFITQIIKDKQAKYVNSECVVCPIRDRFHEFLNFEIEKDLGSYRKWKFKGLVY